MKIVRKYMLMVSLILYILTFTGCGSKSTSSQQENIDSLVDAKVKAILNQQGNEGNQAQDEPREPSYKKFVGTYKFDYCTKDGSYWNCPPIVVMDDGRCIIEYGTAGGGKAPKYLGDVNPISETAFTLSGAYEEFVMEVELYNQSGHYGNTTYKYKWKTRDVVFDTTEGRLYRDKSQYRNRDIEEAVYTKMTFSRSTQKKENIEEETECDTLSASD